MTDTTVLEREPTPKTPEQQIRRDRLVWAIPWLSAIALFAPLSLARGFLAAQLILLALLLYVPGRLLLMALRLPSQAVRRFPVYVPAASLTVLMVTGLLVDLLGHASGLFLPLRSAPLLLGLLAVCCVLVFAASATPPSSRSDLRIPRLPVRHAALLVLPIAAAVGAVRLNSGHGPALAFLAAVAVVLLLALGSLRRRFTVADATWLLYSAALAGLWSYSLRGDLPYGWDIQTETHIAQATWSAGFWSAAHVGDAYGAMLSLTILPAAVHGIAGLSLLAVFKVVLPGLFALLPVAVALIARRYFSARGAFLCGALLVVQPFFFASMPAVARQEVGLLFFACLLRALQERARISAATRITVVMSAGLILSHYTSTYIAIGALALAIVLWACIRRWKGPLPDPRRTVAALLALVLGSVLWYGVVTRSASNLAQFRDTLSSQGLNILPNASGNVASDLLFGNVARNLTPQAYEKEVADQYRAHKSYVHPLPAASDPRWGLQSAPGLATASPLGREANTLLSITTLVINQLVNVLALLGSVLLAIGRHRSTAARQLGLIGSAMAFVLVAIRFSGSIAFAYNQERAQLQALIPLTIGMMAALVWLAQRLGAMSQRPYRRIRTEPSRRLVSICAVALFVLAVNATGLVGASGGTAQQTANLRPAGEEAIRFIPSRQETRAAGWLYAVVRNSSALVYTDRYGQLRWLQATGETRGLQLDITPKTLDGDAWVFADANNVILHQARGQVNGNFSTYRFPSKYLQSYYDVVYDNGGSRVYHGALG